jgi:hypothetical protein
MRFGFLRRNPSRLDHPASPHSIILFDAPKLTPHPYRRAADLLELTDTPCRCPRLDPRTSDDRRIAE